MKCVLGGVVDSLRAAMNEIHASFKPFVHSLLNPRFLYWTVGL